MERHRRIRRSTLATALGAALAVSVFAPPLAGGDVVGDVLNTVGVGGGSADNRAGVPPTYEPPLHGTNPHGQGSIATVDINPSPTNPYGEDPASSGEEIVIGDSRGEQNGSSYHGEVTLLWLLGQRFVTADSNPGETNGGPVDPIVLNTVCGATSVCLNVLTMNSSTSTTGSNNSFEALGADLGGGVVTANVLSSSGNINESGGCQTATGSSSMANGNIGPIPFDVLSSSSSSTACNTGQQSTTNSSNIVNLGGGRVPICADPIANTVLLLAPPPFSGGIVCHADDIGGQTSSPYGVREALSVVIATPPLPIIGTITIKAVLSGPESRAVAPPASPTTPSAGGPAGKKQGGPDDQGEGGTAGAVAGEAGPGEGVLAFTGANLLALMLIGAGLIGLGLLAMAARERQTA